MIHMGKIHKFIINVLIVHRFFFAKSISLDIGIFLDDHGPMEVLVIG